MLKMIKMIRVNRRDEVVRNVKGSEMLSAGDVEERKDIMRETYSKREPESLDVAIE